MGWVVKGTPRPLYPREIHPLPNVQKAGWAPRPVWTGSENLDFTGIRFPHRPARSKSLYRLSYKVLVQTIQNYQRDALNIIYSSNIITLLYITCFEYQVLIFRRT